jgi:hypothetical protein
MTQLQITLPDIETLAKGLRAGSRAAQACAVVLITLACFAFSGAARATDPKPDFAINTKAVEAGVLLDDKIKADPAPAADCLAEGRKWVEKNRAEAEASRKQDPAMFRNDPKVIMISDDDQQ